MTLTQQQIDRDLAEKLLGFEQRTIGEVVYYVRVVDEMEETVAFFPTTSRDDCAEVLAKIPEKARPDVVIALARMVRPELLDKVPYSFDWAFLTATPAQIAEAVWRATCQ